MQHVLSKSSHPCPCANNKKSTAALFCSVACLTEPTPVHNPAKAREVALACQASQHPNLFNSPRALAAAICGERKETAHQVPGGQNLVLSSQSGANARVLHFPLCSLCCKIIAVCQVLTVRVVLSCKDLP